MVTKYLLATDFDGTLAKTFEKSPNGIGINEAYRYAVEILFGSEGLAIYKSQGELRNRSPGEVAIEIARINPSLICFAKEVYEKKNAFLKSLGNGHSLVWNERHENVLTEMLVRFKLSILLDEVGKHWPKPCLGVLGFFETLKNISQSINIKSAILSSGHREFIKKTLAAWNVPLPDIIMITDDEIRHRKYPTDVLKRVKPSIFPFALLHYEWLKNIRNGIQISELAQETRQKIVYFGDDPEKDGKLANNVGVPFGWFNPAGKTYSGNFGKGSFSFGDWREVAEFITSKSRLFSAGMPCAEIFSLFKK
ncbi:MAG: hypothetical protein Q7S18_01515 [bacterium]|nr:hypothetical protein [bacterium]